VKISSLPLDNQVSEGVAARADQLRKQIGKMAIEPIKPVATTEQIGDGRGRNVDTRA